MAARQAVQGKPASDRPWFVRLASASKNRHLCLFLKMHCIDSATDAPNVQPGARALDPLLLNRVAGVAFLPDDLSVLGLVVAVVAAKTPR